MSKDGRWFLVSAVGVIGGSIGFLSLIYILSMLSGCAEVIECGVIGERACGIGVNSDFVMECSAEHKWEVLEDCDRLEDPQVWPEVDFICCEIALEDGPKCYQKDICKLYGQWCGTMRRSIDLWCEGE